jgi:hypothetical protein
MVKFSYTYTLASFLNGYDGKFFSVTLRDSSLSSIYLYQTGSANGDVVIVFRTELTAGEKTILDNIVATTNPQDAPTQSPGNIYEYSEQQAIGTNGGTFTAGSWQTRTLNTSTVTSGLYPHSKLSSNQIILNPGTWYLRASCPAFCVGENSARFYDAAGATAFAMGQVTDSGVLPEGSTTNALVENTATFGNTAAVEIQHRCATSVDNVGFGKATGFGTEVYTTVFVQEYI